MTQVLIGLGFATALAAIGVIVWLYSKGRSAGESKVVADVATATVDTTTKMADAQANAPQGKTDVVKRLREKGL